MRIYRGKAYGKINLFLSVTGGREDGYHTLETVFQTVALCDPISISVTDETDITVKSNRPYLPTDRRNLAFQAAELFYEATGIRGGAQINIKKNLPVGAGMAGGSTDAAAVLRLLNRAWGVPLTAEQMLALGLKLGADVPFCITGGAARGEGIGEKLCKVRCMPECFIVIAKPDFSVSAKNAYKYFDDFSARESYNITPMLDAITRGDIDAICENLRNSLEAPVFKMHHGVERIKSKMLEFHANGAVMTGSGSAVIGIFKDEKQAENAYNMLKADRYQTFLTRPQV